MTMKVITMTMTANANANANATVVPAVRGAFPWA